MASRPSKKNSKLTRSCLSAVLAGLVAGGCASTKPLDPKLNSEYPPDNVYVSWPFLLPQVKRVAVLPMATDTRYSIMIEGRNTLEPVLTAELIKSKRFEVLQVTREECLSATGRSQWTGEEVLTSALFASTSNVFGCDAILFTQLTTFRAYPPLAVGLRMKLVSVHTREILWAGDEIFDAGRPEVLSDLHRYKRTQLRTDSPLEDNWIMENSPRRFGQYTLAQLLGTLPAR